MNRSTMSNNDERGAVLEFPKRKTIDAQAADWLARLDGDAPTKADRQAFKNWIQENAAHREAFEKMLAFYDGMNVLTQVVLPRELMEEHTRVHRTSLFCSSSKAPLMIASCVIVLAVIVAGMLPALQIAPVQEYVTQIGEQRVINLADGSTVLMNTNSRLRVEYTKRQRRLDLLQGEAHFDVFHNPERPFEVYAEAGLVKAIGTAFSVRIRKSNVEVVVTEGTIALGKSENNQIERTRPPPNTEQGQQTFEDGMKITAGSIVTYDRAEIDKVELIVAQEIDSKLSWHHGMLSFNEEPLFRVVEEVGRYTTLNIVIPERSTREIKVGGLFKAGDTESLFEALETGFSIQIERSDSNTVYLISNKDRSSP